MEHIEYEERVLITKRDYKKIIADMKKSGKKLSRFQILNIYLDNADSYIYKTRQMLRIRCINSDEVELTLKIKNEDGTTREINEELNNHPIISETLPGEFLDYKQVAELKTDRYEVKYDDYLLVIDQNIYHGIRDFDIEIEADSQEKARDLIGFYCEKYNLTYDPDYKSKSHRAILRAKQLLKKED